MLFQNLAFVILISNYVVTYIVKCFIGQGTLSTLVKLALLSFQLTLLKSFCDLIMN